MPMSRSRRGLIDWIIQRITALFVGAYAVVIVIFAVTHSDLSHLASAWVHLLTNGWFKFFTVVVLVSVLWHTWIGLWTVFTDYVKNCTVRYGLNAIVMLLLAVYLIWGLVALFGGGY